MERKDTVRQAEYLHGNKKDKQPGNGKVAIYRLCTLRMACKNSPFQYSWQEVYCWHYFMHVVGYSLAEWQSE